jgi:hypothetical protein
MLEVFIVPWCGKLPRKSWMIVKRGNLVNIRHESVGGEGIVEEDEALDELVVAVLTL